MLVPTESLILLTDFPLLLVLEIVNVVISFVENRIAALIEDWVVVPYRHNVLIADIHGNKVVFDTPISVGALLNHFVVLQ